MTRKNGFLLFAVIVGIVSITTALHADERLVDVTYSVGIKGMTCETCSTHVQKALVAVPGVVKATVDYRNGHAWIVVRQSRQPAAKAKSQKISTQLASAVQRAGYKPTVNYVLVVKGMTCEACSKQITTFLSKSPGVRSAHVSYKGGYAVVVPTRQAGPISKSLVLAIRKSGYKALTHSAP